MGNDGKNAMFTNTYMHLQKVILQQSTQLYIILFLVKLTLCMDGVVGELWDTFMGYSGTMLFFFTKISSKIKMISEYEF